MILFCSGRASASVIFNVSPSTVSNTFFGGIILQIGGLTNTETVLVQKYLDANNNGVIDPGEFLVGQYQLTDGQATVFNGVTNYYVPSDLNPSPGAITANLGFIPSANGGDIVQQVAGNFLYKLSSPSGHFAPITNAFAVTSFPFTQTISGTVLSNSLPVPNAVVILFSFGSKSGGGTQLNPLFGAVADNSGNYSIKVPPGTYTPLPFSSSCIVNVAASPSLVISNNSVSTNLFLTGATQTISGQVQNTNNPAMGVPGVFMSAISSTEQIAIGYTDPNGNFTIGTQPGSWKLGFESADLFPLGYLSPQSNVKVTTTSGSVSGVNIGLPKQQAIFFGSVVDGNNNPLPGIRMDSSDSFGNYGDEVPVDLAGYYYAGALTNGPWSVYVSSDNPGYANYVFSLPAEAQNNGTNLIAGQAYQVNFVALIASNTISGTVKDSGNNPITNVQVYANANINGMNFQPSGNTDNNGNYAINVPNGTWYVTVYCGGGQNSLPSGYQCPNSVITGLTNNNAMVNFTIQPCAGVQINTTNVPVGEVNVHYDQFLYASSCAGNFVWTNLSGSLPPGVIFTGNGELTGTPTANGVFNFTAKVTDGSNFSTNQPISLIINNAVLVSTTSLPNATNGLFYSQTLQANNGVTFNSGSPYQWSLTPGSASLPPNLSLSNFGSLTGNLATNGTFNFSVRATDALGGTSDRGLSLFVTAGNVNTNPPPPLATGSYNSSQMYVLYPTAAGSGFALQMTTNLASGPWVPVTNFVPATALIFSNNLPAVFYRLH